MIGMIAGVTARAPGRVYRDIESLPPALRYGDLRRGWVGTSQSTRQVENLFESLLAESFGA
jgi:hypothetical protein